MTERTPSPFEARLLGLLTDVKAGRRPIADALEVLRDLPFEDLGFARPDHHRELRQGFPEVILGEGKTASQVKAIVAEMLRQRDNVLITRVSPALARSLRRRAGKRDSRYIPYFFGPILPESAVFHCGKNIQEYQFIGALLAIGTRRFNRITRIPQIDKINPFDHSTIFHIQTGDDFNRFHFKTSL